MINIISTRASQSRVRGPQKRYTNLIKGLTRIGYPFVVNKDLNATRRLYIQDDRQALRYVGLSKAFKVVGPNLFVMPDDIPEDISLKGLLYLQGCDWAKRMWEHVGFDACPIRIWPVGIDTDMFRPPGIRSSDRSVMVYHKWRDTEGLRLILDALYELHLPYHIVLYGQYDEQEYLRLLKGTSFMIYYSCSESQGMALQEAMACDVPIVVCDAISIFQEVGEHEFDNSLRDFLVTSAPYFDETCGIKITDLSQLKHSIEFMMDNLKGFAPREYVLHNLSLEGQARAFVKLWEHWGLTLEQGMSETARTDKDWRIPLSSQVWGKVKWVYKSLAR